MISPVSGPGFAPPLLSPRETASLDNGSRFFVRHPEVAYGDALRGVPRFLLLDAFLGRTLIEQARQTLDAMPQSLGQLLSGFQKPGNDALRISLERIARSVGGLQRAAQVLGQDGAYRQGRAFTSDGTDLTLKATATDGVGSPDASLEILALARAHEISSDPQADAGAALDRRGSFTLNGVEVPVLATDDLYALALRINAGEDANRNGRLDGAEDRNFSLTLDPYEDTNRDGRLDTVEDTNGNGALDQGEDLNQNGRLDVNEDLDFDFMLDGGTAAHGVEARVDTGRLILRRARGGPEGLSVEDPDGILASVGLVGTDARGAQIFPNVRVLPEAASLTKDGQALTLDSNVSTSVLQGVTVELRREGAPAVTVGVRRDPSRTVAAVRDFVAEFNAVVRGLNGFLDDGGTTEKEPRVQRFRRALERATQDPLKEAPLPAGAAGLEALDVTDESFSELQIRGALDRLRQGLQGVFDQAHGIPSAAGHLSQLGIVGLEDDTLALDEGALAKALAEDPAAVKRLLSGEEGIATRVAAALVSAVDPDLGALPRFRKALEGVSLKSLAEGIRAFQKAQTFGQQASLLAVA